MKFIHYLNILTILLLFNCSASNTIEHKIIPAESFVSNIINENCVSIISRNFEIVFQEIKEEQMENILKNYYLKLEKIRLSKLFFCRITLENSGLVPLEVGNIKLHYDDTVLNPLKADIINYYNRHLSEINFNEILGLFKLTTDDLCDYEFNFGEDFIKYKSGFIQPGDKVTQILIFNRLPVNTRKFTLSIVIKSDITQKIIDFKLMKFEYRKTGKHFINKKKDDND